MYDSTSDIKSLLFTIPTKRGGVTVVSGFKTRRDAMSKPAAMLRQWGHGKTWRVLVILQLVTLHINLRLCAPAIR